MSSQSRQDMIQRAGKVFETQVLSQAESRKSIVVRASRIIDLLRRRTPADSLSDADIFPNMQSAPEEIPTVRHMGRMTWPGEEDFSMPVISSLGEFYARMFTDQGPGAVFDTAFYAGVLAAKEGLIDVDQFVHDSEMRRQLPVEES